jgi:hypothetical protein
VHRALAKTELLAPREFDEQPAMFESRLILLAFDAVDDGRGDRGDFGERKRTLKTTALLHDFSSLDIDANRAVLAALPAHDRIDHDDADGPHEGNEDQGPWCSTRRNENANDNR